eukprot:365297_1
MGHYVGVQSLWPYHHAAQYCKHHYGTEVATIINEEDQKMASKLCMKICMKNTGWCQCWIGLQRPHHEWDDGTSADEKFTNWWPGQPDNWGRSEGCTELVAKHWGGKWNDLHCGHPRYFLCNLQTPVQRMDFYDREEMIATRITRHKVRWQKYQEEARRKKIRNAFFEQLRQKQAMMRKHRREQEQRMREYYRQQAFGKMMNGFGGGGGFGARSAFYGDLYAKKRRLRQWIEEKSEGMKRVNELRLEEKKHKRQRVQNRQMMKARARETDVDELFYRMSHTEEEEEEEELRESDEDNPNPGPRRCVFVATDALYELCFSDASILISKYMQKVVKHVYTTSVFEDELSPNASEYDTMQFDELERFRYREAMDYDEKETRDLSMQIH